MGIVVFIIVIIIGFVLFKFFSDMKDKREELSKVGGIKNKYQELISGFDDFDVNQPPAVIDNSVDNYEIGWQGNFAIIKLRFFEVLDNLHVILKSSANVELMQYVLTQSNNYSTAEINQQIETMKRQINKQQEWKFPTSMSQEDMLDVLYSDLNKLMGDNP